MQRTIDQAFLDLREQIGHWARAAARPDVRFFVYPPEWEALVLARFPAFVETCAQDGRPVSLLDVGQGFLSEVDRRRGFVERLTEMERRDPHWVLHDLGEIAARYLTRLLTAPLEPPAVGRILINTGTLGTFVSYSAVTNDLQGSPASAGGVQAPAVLAFPGEGDERSLSLLGLRRDTNYRAPRV